MTMGMMLWLMVIAHYLNVVMERLRVTMEMSLLL